MSLRGTVLWEDQLHVIFVPKEQRSWLADFICLYANRLNINIERIKLSSVFLNTQNQSGKTVLFTMTTYYQNIVSFSPLLTYFHPKPQWILNHGPWTVVFIKVNQGHFLLLSLSRKEERKLGSFARTYQDFHFTEHTSSFPSPSTLHIQQVPLSFIPSISNLSSFPYL